MKIINKIIEEMKLKRISQKEMCDAIGVGTSTFSNWKNRGTDPPVRYIPAICELLGWNVSEVMGAEEYTNVNISATSIEHESPNEGMCAATKELIECYNGLSLSNKAKVMTLVAALQQEEANG